MSIDDVRGRKYSAKRIFTLSIKALVDHFKSSFQRQNVSDIKDDDIKWVLTVPAIWSEAAKKFMRHCATDVSTFKIVFVMFMVCNIVNRLSMKRYGYIPCQCAI